MRASWLGWQSGRCHSQLTHNPSTCRQLFRLPGSQQRGSHPHQELHSTCSSAQYGRRPVLVRASLHQHAQHQEKQQFVSSCRKRARQMRARQVIAKIGRRGPPQPADKFDAEDVKRIKQQGPRFEELFTENPEDVLKDYPDPKDLEYFANAAEELGAEIDEEGRDVMLAPKRYIPSDVLGPNVVAPEPKWRRLKNMSFREFYYGLQQRNWTSKFYDPSAEPWDLKFFTDGGKANFQGYKVLLTKADGSQWRVFLPQAGAENYLEHHLGSLPAGSEAHERARFGTRQAAVLDPRLRNTDPYELEAAAVRDQEDGYIYYGYNQVFEQLFQAYEQQLPTDARNQYAKNWQLQTKQSEYNCPGDRSLALSFHMTPTKFRLWDKVEAKFDKGIVFLLTAASVLAAVIAYGVVKPPDEVPQDLQAAKEYAQSKAKARVEGKTDVKLADVAGLDHIIDRVKQVVQYLQQPMGEHFTALARPPKGILLEGDPGVGKTLLAKAIAGEANVPFFQMSGSEFTEAIVGVGAARVRDLFKRARAQRRPCIIFVDEIDSMGSKRAGAGAQTNEEREQTLNQLLTEMDGFIPGSGVVFMAATNRADQLDQALTRPGRFDWRITVDKPNLKARVAILQVHCRKRPMADDVDFNKVARDLPGLTGAELANVMNEASLSAVARQADTINMSDIYYAGDRVLQGLRRPGLPRDSEARKYFAVHEVGKGIVGTVLREQTGILEAVDRMSIVARGRVHWSATTFLRGADEDYILTTRLRMLERLQVILAGRAAEEVAMGHPSTYSYDDLTGASKLAVKMVTNYGLSDFGITTFAMPNQSLGFKRASYEVNVDTIDNDVIQEGMQGKQYEPSGETVTAYKSEAYSMVTEAYDKNLEILRRHSDALRHGTLELLKLDTMTGEALRDIMAKNPPQGQDQNGAQLDVDRGSSEGARKMDQFLTPVGAGNERSS